MMTLSEIRNGICILRSIDSHELGDPPWYGKFAAAPCDFLMRCTDANAETIWAAMVKRGAVKGESQVEHIKARLDNRLNDHLCEMKPDYDDSIVGFNEAWDVMRGVFAAETAALPSAERAGS